MKYFQRSVWLVLAFHLVVLIFVAVVFQVDDMTLSKGEVYKLNKGWIFTGSDGEHLEIQQLPFLGESMPDEQIVLENIIPKEYFGLTLAFLSADQILRVWMDDNLVYEFGVEDVRGFGHTPGSVYNFIDIPFDLTQGKVRMEITSPYSDYAARLSSITIGERDVLILKLLQSNIVNIICNLVIVICGINFFMLFLIQLASHQDTGGMQYLCGYCIVASLYYFVETKILHIFYGNQTFYSVMVFLCLMILPFFIALYYANGMLGIFRLRWRLLLGLICINIVIQIGLQLTNIVDFMNMAFVSHALIALTVLVVAWAYWDILKEKRDNSVLLGMLGLLFMGIGGTVDIVRMYVVAASDMGKYSRFGTTCFSLIMLFQHFRQVIKGYAKNTEENARLLKHEMELIEKKNEQLKKANEQAEEARQDALAANTAKGKFLAQMSHEIRTPINAVLGMDTMILREAKNPQIKEYALDIQNAGQNLLALINDILDFSKIESGKLEIIPVEYDFSSLIHDISNMLSAKAEAKKLKLQIHVQEKLPSKLLGDDVRVRQVLVNLLNNAVKYTPKGSVTLDVQGRIEGRKAILDFAVQDTGIGIKEEDISKLFQEFERIEEKRNRNIEGTGLGINITTQLLLLMGSRLKVESVYGQGSCFSFTLEQQIVDSTPIGNLEQRIREQSTEYTYTSAFIAPDARLLVVDDNLMNLKVFVNLLKDIKVQVDVADSGKACLERVEEKHYDLIFLDHMMPEMDGIETLHRMKELKENLCLDSPVVALTANAITGAKEMYLTEGFDAFLPKPIHPEKLEQMILKLLPRELLLFDTAKKVSTEETEEGLVQNSQMGEKRVEIPQVELPMVDGIDWSYGLLHLPDQELLLGTVCDFYKTLNIEADTLEEFYQQSKEHPDMLVQYRIKVHAMKSSANLIGATVLGGMAKLLEYAARDNDRITIDALHAIFLREWRSYREKLEEIIALAGGEQGEQEKQAIEDKAVILTYLDRLQTAMTEMDIDEMDEIMAKLEGFQYPDEIQEDMEKLSVFITNMDSEQAVFCIEKLKNGNMFA